MRTLVMILALSLAPALAHAACLASLDESKYRTERGKQDIAVAGERFRTDLKACNPELAAAFTEYVRYEIHDQEAASFVRHAGFVKLAYGVAWALVALAAAVMYLRQRRLEQTLDALESKLRGKP
jgi:hypothetical protein